MASSAKVLSVNNRAVDVPRPYLRWYFIFFVISGFCGLVYEVIWVRLAMADFGVNTALVSIVLSIFMAGLGIGAWGARFIQRLGSSSPSNALRLYAAVEFTIGVSSFVVPYQLRLSRHMLLHAQAFASWQTSAYFAASGCLLTLALLPWCICMGSTFPLLMSVIRGTSGDESKFSFSYLYIANVLGALAGTLISAYVLIELLGFEHTLLVAGALNATIGILACWLSFRVGSISSKTAVASGYAFKERSLYGLPRLASLFFLFATGMVSMGLEVVWIRQFTPYLGTVVYTFAGILAAYLLGTLLGSQDYRRWIRLHSSNESRSTWTVLAFSSVVPLVAADPLLPLINPVFDSMRFSVIAFFCAAAGFLTPLLVDTWSTGDPDRAGTAYAVNIAGCLLGPLVSSFLLLPVLGERLTVAVLCIPLFAIAGFLSFQKPSDEMHKTGSRRSLKFLLASVVAVLIVTRSHDFDTRFKVRKLRRDYTATVVATGEGLNRELRVNGVGMTNLTPITKYIADLPLAFMTRPPQNGLVICFGMGTTFRSMVSWGIPTTVVDLVPSVPALFDYFHSDADRIRNAPNARIVIDDGRRYLDGSTETFDVIVVDPPPPVPAAGSSLLYSREFYEVIKRHLRPGGIVQIWYPIITDTATNASVAKALLQSFPYVRAFLSFDESGIHYLASMEPIPTTSSDALAAKLPPAAALDFVEWGPASTTKTQFETVLNREIPLKRLVDENPNVPALSDDRPVNEYYMLRRWFGLNR